MMQKTAAELAAYVGGRVIGDETVVLTGVAGADTAMPTDVAYLLPEYEEWLPQVRAGAVLVAAEPVEHEERTLIVVENPKWAFASLVELYHPAPSLPVGIHPTAVVDPTARVDPTASVLAYAVIGAETVVGPHAVIHPHVVLGARVVIGEDTVVYAGAVLHDRTELGARVVVRANAVLGGEGFGFATEDGRHARIPQIGRVTVGDDVEIGACTTIDNATFGETSIGRGTKIDNLVHLGHNVRVGEDCFIIAQVGVAGSTTIGNHVVLAGQVGVTGHITIADNVTCGGKAGVVGSLTESGTYVGYPARPHRQWGRIEASLNHLPELVKRVKNLEKSRE